MLPPQINYISLDSPSQKNLNLEYHKPGNSLKYQLEKSQQLRTKYHLPKTRIKDREITIHVL